MIGLLTDQQLETIRTGEDTTLVTEFLNGGTFTSREMKAYPYHLRKTYLAGLEGDGETIRFYAVDDETAREYLAKTYDLEHFPLEYFAESITTTRLIDLED